MNTNNALSLEDIMLLLRSSDLQGAFLEDMLTKAKRAYVEERHNRKIYQTSSSNPYKDGSWKTHVFDQDGHRKEIIRKTEAEIYEVLYSFYVEKEKQKLSMESVFEMLMDRKANELNRSSNTIMDDRRYFSYLSDKIKKSSVISITESDLRSWFVKSYMPKKPKEQALRKMIQLLNQIFSFAIHQKMCKENPAANIVYDDYAKDCDIRKKKNEERAFSEQECMLLEEDALRTKNNPRSLMRLFSIHSAVRAGELPPLRWEDVSADYVHVHRQQVRDISSGHEVFLEVDYTKDERKHPHGGRYIPRTKALNSVLELAKLLPGESEYIFHDKNGQPISKNSYELHLRRACKKLGISTTNNHAFRIAYNSFLLNSGLSASERALILGHGVQTNEHYYSVTDQRTLASIKERIDSIKTDDSSRVGP